MDVSRVTESKPSEVLSISVFDSNGSASNGVTLAQPTDLSNVGVRDWLLFMSVTGATTAGTYTVRVAFRCQDLQEFTEEGLLIVP